MSAGDRALCCFAEDLTERPKAASREWIEALRKEGFSDRAIHDATQCIAYFNYINRVADALGVDPEPGIRAWERPEA